MLSDVVIANTVVAVILVPMVWYMLREQRAAMNGLAREVSDLTLVMALDVATRPSANKATRDIARAMVKSRDGLRARQIESGEDDSA